MSHTFIPPSQLIAQPDRLPDNALQCLDELFRVSLSLHPDGRFATRQEWLAAWDRLHLALQNGDRLSGFEQRFLGWIEYIASCFQFGKDR